jgi:hypothetical protein
VSQRHVERCPASAKLLLACEGELPEAQGQCVLAHLSRCEACQEFVQGEIALRGDVSLYHLSQYDPNRVYVTQHTLIQKLRDPAHVRSMRPRVRWAHRPALAAAAVMLIAVTSGLAMPERAEALGGMLARFAVVIQQTLFGTEPRQQAHTINRSERTPAAAPAPAPAPTVPADDAETSPQTGPKGPLPDRDTLDQAELDARLVLSDASLDLLRGIRVSSTPKAVRVEGIVPAQRPRRRVAARLNALPYVHASLRAGPAAGNGSNELGTPVTGLSRLVDIRLGDRPEKRTFVPKLAGLVSAITARIDTMRGFAERYSDDAVKELSPAARGKLQKLLDHHYQLLSVDLDALDEQLAILFGSRTRVFPTRRAPSDWQQRVNVGFAHAEWLDRSLRELRMLDELPPVPPDDDVPAGRAVTNAFGALWDAVHAGRP